MYNNVDIFQVSCRDTFYISPVTKGIVNIKTKRNELKQS